jgi:hypothetical protein
VEDGADAWSIISSSSVRRSIHQHRLNEIRERAQSLTRERIKKVLPNVIHLRNRRCSVGDTLTIRIRPLEKPRLKVMAKSESRFGRDVMPIRSRATKIALSFKSSSGTRHGTIPWAAPFWLARLEAKRGKSEP